MSETVFASGAGGGEVDLLQRAFQQVVDDEQPAQQQQQQQQQREFLAFLQSDNGDAPQVIQLTPEQAAALGINIVDLDTQEEPAEAAAAEDAGDVDGFQEQQPTQQTLSQEDTQRIIDELAQSGLLKRKDDTACALFDEWTVQPEQQNEQNQDHRQESLESNLALESVPMDNDSDNQIEEETSNFFHIQSNETNKFLQEQEVSKSSETQCNGKVLQSRIQFTLASNNIRVDNVSESQAQILQRFPVILPSSQFIIKPAQTVLTPVKNIRILPNTTKVSTAQTSQNSLFLPKTTLLNTISPQLIKAMPIGTQFLRTTNNISTQLLNTSQLVTKSNNNSNNQFNESLIKNTSIINTPTLTKSLVRQTSVQKPVQTQVQQKVNLQQFFTPLLKTTSNALAVVKSNSLLNSNVTKQNSKTPFLKSINSTHMLKTTLMKNPVISLPLTKSTNSPVIFKTTPMLKSEESSKSTASALNPVVRTQISSTPVSILKPQAKAGNGNVARQNLTSLLTQKSSLTKSVELSESLKPLVTAKLKQSVNSIMKSIKKRTIPQKLVTVKQESTEGSKPLGSSENPIQIVQQGDTFHSMHRLTQAQLKQIAQALQQRTQQSANSNEKVVYRLVFPDELDMRMKNSNLLLKNKNGKRGRPKKSAVKTSGLSSKPTGEEEQDEAKDERKKVVARTRSGRLSRPPRHMVRDYRHLHHMDFAQPDLDDSDGGYSDYNASGSKPGQDDEEAGPRTELLAGLEVPKRKISDHFRCPTCSKIYLGRTRMARHFEMHPDHGSPDQLPPPTAEPEIKTQTTPADPLKRKGKKRGPWAYVTPEAKSERRQLKLREAITVCESSEISKIAAKPVVDSLSLFDLLLLKSENNVHTFLAEVKELVERVRDKTSTMLSAATSSDDKLSDDIVHLNEELLCDVLALNSGIYKVNEPLSAEEPDTEEKNLSENFEMSGCIEPPLKMQKTESILEEGKENIEERLSSGFSESSDLSVTDFFNDRRSESTSTSINCPEVLSALTLMPRNSSASPENDVPAKVVNVPKVLNSGVDMHTTISPGFQKLSINAATKANPNFIKEGAFTKLGDNLESNCTDVFTKFNGNFDQSKMDNMQRTFIKLEPTEEGFIKLENGVIGSFHEEMEDFGKIQSNGFHYISGSISDNFNGKGFRKLVPKTMSTTATVSTKEPDLDLVDSNNSHEVSENSIQITTSGNGNGADTNIFESNNLDIAKMTDYDHMTHLDILNGSGVIDKNLMIDEKLVEHLQLVDNSNMNIVDELVSERLKSIMPENLLDGNLLQHNGNLDTELDFEELSEEFNRNTRS